MARKKTYAVARGRKTGLFTNWPEAEAQVKGFAGARFKGFSSSREAEEWLQLHKKSGGAAASSSPPTSRPVSKKPVTATTQPRTAGQAPHDDFQGILIYTDGGCSGNPGPGGYGAVIRQQGQETELSGGYRLTTNNRMEMMACIAALRSVKGSREPIMLYSDSSYVVNAITKGWAKSWQRRGWVKSDRKPALNPDLWQELLQLIEALHIDFRWVKGHSGNPLNERCDRLAVTAGKGDNLPPDTAYELHKSQADE
ncbi:MAG: ribonuclease HI [Desulfobulbaceae bacterium]|uniref:Ribonuclease H n=1 Tax=Candidatus Desulfatifera sulfidica TaxID=2841691 RepID=A0A8J6N7F3_9BACT|nr:ribonuclease HI [Candidatus Desulfatifera sulfidica]